MLFGRQFGRQLLVRRSHCGRDLCLHLHRQRRRARLTEQGGQKLRRSPLALTIVGHQQCGESHQSRARLTLRHARGQLCTRRFSAARTGQPMPLMLGDQRLDRGQFPHLMPQRLRVAARQLFPTTTACGRLQRLHVVAVFDWNQRPLVLLVAGLPTALLLRFPFPRGGPGVRMLRAGRRRRVLRRLAFHLPSQLLKLRFQFRQSSQQRANHRLGFRRLTGDAFFREMQRHAIYVAEKAYVSRPVFSKQRVPACERLCNPRAAVLNRMRVEGSGTNCEGSRATLEMRTSSIKPSKY